MTVFSKKEIVFARTSPQHKLEIGMTPSRVRADQSCSQRLFQSSMLKHLVTSSECESALLLLIRPYTHIYMKDW